VKRGLTNCAEKDSLAARGTVGANKIKNESSEREKLSDESRRFLKEY